MLLTRRMTMAGMGALAVGAAAGKTYAAAPDALAKLHASVDDAVSAHEIPGALGLVWQRGHVVDVRVAGDRGPASHAPLTRDSIFPLASMTKPVTVAGALRLMEQGKLKLDDPIVRWLPEFANMRVLKRSDGPLDETYPAPRLITIEDLMTHRSGLTYGFTSPTPLGRALMARLGFGIDSALTPDQWLARLAALPLTCAPGERFEYGHSIDVLGLLIGRVMGQSFQQVMADELFGPLGMADTGFWVPPVKRNRLVPGSMSTVPGNFQPAPIAAYTAAQPPAYASGGQGLAASADDYCAFASMLVRGGQGSRGRVLKRETVRLMTTNRLTPEQRARPFFGLPLFASSGFGLGMSVITNPSKAVVGSIGAFGWPGAFGGWWQGDPARQLVAIWLQACVPAPPAPGTVPHVPGAAATLAFQRAVYAAFE